MHYLCIVFFMVLDLRLTIKIVVVVRQPFFFNSTLNSQLSSLNSQLFNSQLSNFLRKKKLLKNKI